MQGTRRIDEMAANARQLAYQENYSYTEGWDDNVVAEIFNLGLNRLYDKICQVDNVANIEEYVADVYAGVQEYDIPQAVKMGLQIMNVRFLYGTQSWMFVTLAQGMIQDRYSYPTNIPTTFCIRNKKLLLSPTPNITRTASLIVNYQKRMRKIDFRRGKVSNITSAYGTITGISKANPCVVTTAAAHGLVAGQKVGINGVFEPSELIDNSYIISTAGLAVNEFSLNGVSTLTSNTFSGTANWFSNPVTFLLDFTISSQKDTNLQANADSILDKVDWACIVDKNGDVIIDAIPVSTYGFTSQVLTADSNYVIPISSFTAFTSLVANLDTPYVVTGDYTSTHSQLDRQSEDLLIEYCVLRLLRLQSAAEPTVSQMAAEEAVLDRLAISYRRYRPSIVPIIFQQRLRQRQSFWGSRGSGA
jgi:hypothetical protein